MYNYLEILQTRSSFSQEMWNVIIFVRCKDHCWTNLLKNSDTSIEIMRYPIISVSSSALYTEMKCYKNITAMSKTFIMITWERRRANS